jgi:hypothetical protein
MYIPAKTAVYFYSVVRSELQQYGGEKMGFGHIAAIRTGAHI